MALTDRVRRRSRELALDQEFLDDQADMIPDRVARYRLFEDYRDGEQRTRLMARAQQYLQASGLCFAENFCETVIDTLATRLRIENFHHEDEPDLAEWLNGPWWRRNRMGELQTIVHANTPTLGDGFVIVEFDESIGMPRARWNHPRNLKPTYDEETGELALLSKVWASSKVTPTNPDGRLIRRLNLYYPDRVEKYFSLTEGKGSRWVIHRDTEDETGVVWNTTTGEEGGEPLGIPVAHFRNRARGRTFGRSDLRGAIPFQDELNKQLMDLFYVMDAQAWNTRWATGVSDESQLTVAPGNWIRTSDKDARFGSLDAQDPGGMLDSIEATLRRMSLKTGTPMFALHKGAPPSGESLKTEEGGLIARGEDCQEGFGGAWADVAAISVRQMLAFGEGLDDVDPEALLDLDVMWEPIATRNERDETETFVMQHELGVSRRTILTKLGYDAEAEEKQRAKEDERDAPPAAPPPADTPPPPADPAEPDAADPVAG